MNKILHILSLLFFLLSLPFLSIAQSKSKIEIKQADRLEGAEINGQKIDKLIGNCAFMQDNVIMYCDSAYIYSSNNADAFGHVHIVQGDTINLYGDLLKYNGNTKKAELFNHIRFTDRTTVLTTEHMIYDMLTDVGIYNENAKIVDKENVLTSVHGFYYSGKKEFFFKDNVVLTNPKYVMKSDTLRYNTITKTAFFFGPTTITSDENLIYCENGWYNTANETSQFKKNSYINTKEQQLRGDSLLYDRKTGTGKAFKNVVIIDTTQKVTITGEIGTHYRLNQLSVVTGKAMMMQRVDKDTLFMHADTLQASFDSLKNERKLYAYHHVKVFKTDLQAVCDSLAYSSIDSTMRLYKDPIIWSGKNQLTSDFVTLELKNKQLAYMHMYTNSFIISQEDSLKRDTTKFNQVKGKNMTGYFRDNNLYKIKVEGNGQTIYYGKNKFNKIIGVNRADCSDLWIYLKDNKLQSIVLLTKPEATFSPLKETKPEELILKDFKWMIYKRPKDRYSIF